MQTMRVLINLAVEVVATGGIPRGGVTIIEIVTLRGEVIALEAEITSSVRASKVEMVNVCQIERGIFVEMILHHVRLYSLMFVYAQREMG
tara:strand:+ start:135 stop:404 length:270 start_codon:yes stop_codon:yes gene_type:complete